MFLDKIFLKCRFMHFVYNNINILEMLIVILLYCIDTSNFMCTSVNISFIVQCFTLPLSYFSFQSMSVTGFTVAGKGYSELKSIFVCEERGD